MTPRPPELGIRVTYNNSFLNAHDADSTNGSKAGSQSNATLNGTKTKLEVTDEESHNISSISQLGITAGTSSTSFVPEAGPFFTRCNNSDFSHNGHTTSSSEHPRDEHYLHVPGVWSDIKNTAALFYLHTYLRRKSSQNHGAVERATLSPQTRGRPLLRAFVSPRLNTKPNNASWGGMFLSRPPPILLHPLSLY